MLLYVYDSKKGFLNLGKAIAIEYYGKVQRKAGLHEGTTLLVSFEDGSRYVIYGITLDEIQHSIITGKNKTFARKWEKVGPMPDAILELE